MRFQWMLMFSLGWICLAQDLSKLPSWAAREAEAAARETAPAGEQDAWVLLERTEVAYGGENEIWTRRFRLMKVLGERGISQGTYAIHGLGGKATQVKRLKGWNLRPDGELTKIDQDLVVSIEDASDSDFSRATVTAAAVPRVAKGSLVAFESLEVTQLPFGPVTSLYPLGAFPVRRWELDLGKREGWFQDLRAVEIRMDFRNFGTLLPKPAATPGQPIVLTNLPPLPREEGGHPAAFNLIPGVIVRFLDPKLAQAPIWDSWDRPAAWFAARYAERAKPAGIAQAGASPLEGLKTLWTWMARSLAYKQVYLSPDRGWIPEEAPETARKRYGDCKDMTCFLIAEAGTLGFKAHPALARISEGRIDATDTPANLFNHVITALELPAPSGLGAEVATPRGRFLLLDPTDPLTPVGLLGSAHRNGKVMICLPDGALWVDIPEAACPAPEISIRLEGEGRADGTLDGTLRLRETHQAWGLREVAKSGSNRALRDHLLKAILDLPPTATLEVEQHSDPLDLTGPFTASLRIHHPGGAKLSGGELSLAAHGWNIVPGLPQPAGVPRVYPVERNLSGILRYEATVKVPYALEALLPEKSIKTPFREATWQAQVQKEGPGSLLQLRLEHRQLPARFPYEAREEGVQAWKKDRTAIRNLRIDGMSFRKVP